MSVSKVSRETIINKLGFLYGKDRAQNIYKKINELIDRYQKNSAGKITKADFLNVDLKFLLPLLPSFLQIG